MLSIRHHRVQKFHFRIFSYVVALLLGLMTFASTPNAWADSPIPSAPLLTITGHGDGMIDLAWTAPPYSGTLPIADYLVEMKTASSTWTPVDDGVSVATNYSVTDLTNGIVYSFRLSAINGNGVGAISNVVNEYPSTVPGPVSLSQVPSNISDTALSIAWSVPSSNGGSQILGYRVQQSTDLLTWVDSPSVVINGTSAVVSDLSRASTYIFRVAAVNRDGLGAWPDTITSASVGMGVDCYSTIQSHLYCDGYWPIVDPDGYNAYWQTHYWNTPAYTSYKLQHIAKNNITFTTKGSFCYVTSVWNTTGNYRNGVGEECNYSMRVALPEGAIATTGLGEGGTCQLYNDQSFRCGPSVLNNVSDAMMDWSTSAYCALQSGGIATCTSGSYSKVKRLVSASCVMFLNQTLSCDPTNGGHTGNEQIQDATAECILVTSGSVYCGSKKIVVQPGIRLARGSTQSRGCVITFLAGLSCWGQMPNSYGGDASTVSSNISNSSGFGAGVASVTPRSPVSTVTSHGATSASLSWSVPDDGGQAILDYVVQYSSNNGLSWSTYDDGISSLTSATVTGLTSGAIYNFRVAAKNTVGVGPYSNVVSEYPSTIPSAPLVSVDSYSGDSATIVLSNPAQSGKSGGAVVTGWALEYSLDGSHWYPSVSPTRSNDYTFSALVANLQQGRTYFFRAAMLNRDGQGAYSPAISMIPAIVPQAPVLTVQSHAASSVSLSWSAPDDGGQSLTDYVIQYSSDHGASWSTFNDGVSLSTSSVVTGLVSGTVYSFRVAGTNLLGVGTWSSLVTPQATASAPLISSVATAVGRANITFSAPAENGGSEISNYEYSTDGGSTWVNASPAQTTSPLVISGLSNGTTYSVKLRAVNSLGAGAASDPVSVKPIAPASAPTISGVTSGNGQATLSISAPAQLNDSSLSGYDYSTNNGSTWSHFASVTGPFTITGLTNGTAYQVKVRAVNSAGAGEASSVVTVNPTKLLPAKPVIGSIIGGNASATINITTPTDVTAQSVTGYQYSINKGATYQNAVVSNGSFTVSGLTNGVSTSVQIRATNFNGNSLASLAKTVVPATTPAAPIISAITPSAGALSIAFTAPSNGGSAITGYQYSLDGGSTWVVPKTAVKTSPLKVTGLPNATAYQVKIRAVNVIGAGLASDAVSASTPVLVPSAPTTTSIAKSSTTFTVDVTAPVNNGGGAITNYAYSVDNGKTWTEVSPASNSTRIVISGLKSNTTYPVQIAALNSAGRGAPSAKYNAGTLR